MEKYGPNKTGYYCYYNLKTEGLLVPVPVAQLVL